MQTADVETGEITALAIPDRLELLIANIKEPKDVRKAINTLDALAKIATAVNEGTEAQNEIAIKRIEAIRLGGQMLSEIEREPGGRPQKNSLPQVTSFDQALTEMGISRKAGVDLAEAEDVVF